MRYSSGGWNVQAEGTDVLCAFYLGEPGSASQSIVTASSEMK